MQLIFSGHLPEEMKGSKRSRHHPNVEIQSFEILSKEIILAHVEIVKKGSLDDFPGSPQA